MAGNSTVPGEHLLTTDGRARFRPRRALSLLFLYHALLLAGGAILLTGLADGVPLEDWLGTGALVAGLCLFVGVLAWTARLARHRPPDLLRSPVASPSTIAPNPRGGWLCSACGWRGGRGEGFCPRCGKILVRLFTEPDPLRE